MEDVIPIQTNSFNMLKNKDGNRKSEAAKRSKRRSVGKIVKAVFMIIIQNVRKC